MRARVIVLSVIVCVLSALTYANAATYYVNNSTGASSDSNPGTESSPWKTISHAIAVAVGGDTVWVRTGVYYDSLLIARSGSAGSYITFAAYPGDSPIIDGSQNARDKFIEWKGSASGGTDKHYIVFDGFEVRNMRRWAFWIEGDHNIIRNCHIHHCGPSSSGVAVLIRQGDYNSIINNDVHDCGWNGINAENSNYTTIEYNRSYDNNEHFGINVFPNTGEAQIMQYGNNIRYNVLYNNMGGIYTRYQRENEIVGNVIYNNREGGIFLHSHGDGPSTYAAYGKIYNNTIVGNGFHAIWDVSATHLTIKNNILANHYTANRYYEIFINGGKTAGHVIDGNLYYPDAPQLIYWGGAKYDLEEMRSVLGMEENGVAADPGFTSLANNDYTLREDSNAIDIGLDLRSEGIINDLLGNARPQGAGFDIGAYEYATGTTPPPSTTKPLPPQNIRVVPAQ